MKYLWLPRLSISNANAQPSAWLVAAPSPTAYLGFAHQTGRVLGTFISGVAIVHHHLEFRAEKLGRDLSPHQFRAAGLINGNDYASTNKHALALQPSARCNVTVSLALECEDDASLPGDVLSDWLARARIAGGSVNPDFEAPVPGIDSDQLTEQLKTGFSVVERSDLMKIEVGDRDRLDAFLRATSRQHRATDPFVSPALLGYRAITAFKERERTRGDYPHAFAEPLIGLTQFKPVREEGLKFWRYRRPSSDLFLATTH